MIFVSGYTKDGILRTKVYYCDAGCPHQKGSIEVNHELIQRVLPRGVTFDNLTQEKVDIMMNHINSYSRLKLGNKTPFEAFEFYYGSVNCKVKCNTCLIYIFKCINYRYRQVLHFVLQRNYCKKRKSPRTVNP